MIITFLFLVVLLSVLAVKYAIKRKDRVFFEV